MASNHQQFLDDVETPFKLELEYGFKTTSQWRSAVENKTNGKKKKTRTHNDEFDKGVIAKSSAASV